MTITYDTALEHVKERLGEHAVRHSTAVADTAAQLASIYGADADEARLAGLLHDWDREQEHESLFAAAAAAGHDVHSTEEASPKLLHARTGAAALRDAFPGIEDDVVRAVERHTLGAPDMQPLDMIVYIADMIEPGRVYPGVDDLREAVGTLSLDELFATSFQRTVMQLVRARKPIHPLTVDVWNEYVARGRA